MFHLILALVIIPLTEDNENMFDIKFSIDDQLFWETLKIMLCGKTISYSTFKKKERVNIEFELESLALALIIIPFLPLYFLTRILI
jgi:hypothetical protein